MASWIRRLVEVGLVTATVSAVGIEPGMPSCAAGQLERVSLPDAAGRSLVAVLAAPAATPAPGVVLLHRGTGLGELAEAFERRLADSGFLVLAPDLFNGRLATDDALVHEANADPDRTLAAIVAAIDWLRRDPRGTGKVGVVGYSFGAGWAIEASVATPVDATVAYVGLSYPDADALAALRGPILAHLGERDPQVTPGHAKLLEKAMAAAAKSLQIHWYPNDHYFPFPTFPTFDSASAAVDAESNAGIPAHATPVTEGLRPQHLHIFLSGRHSKSSNWSIL